MKKLIVILGVVFFSSCNNERFIYEPLVFSSIKLHQCAAIDQCKMKYQCGINSSGVFLLTNRKYQIGDTLK